MTQTAPRDANQVPALLGTSSSDGTTVTIYANPVTHRLLVDTGGSGSSLTVTDGITTVTPVTTIDFTSGATVTDGGGGTADVAITAGGSGTVTSVATGTGLTGGPITTTGTITLDTKLAPMDTLTGNSLKVLRVNAGETAVEYATPAAGTVTAVSVASANGFAGSSSGGATPALTLTTTVTAPALAGNGTAIAAATTTGSGSTIVLATGATLITPTLGVAAATSINKVTITAPATGSTLTIADGKTLTQSNTLTYTGTDGSSVAFGTGGTVLYANQSITLSGDVTGSGTTAITTTVAKIAGTVVSSTTGSTNVVFSNSPTLVTPTLGVASATTINKVTLTAPATGSTLTIADGKTLTASNSLTLAGTDSTTMTFPSGSATVAGLGTTQTFTGQDKFNNIIDVNNAVTVSSNAGTVPVTFRLNTFTNSSAATMAITMATASAVDGQMTIVRIYDATGVAETIGWTNTENSTVSVPTTSNGSTTLPLTVGFMYNSATSKWRCIASA